MWWLSKTSRNQLLREREARAMTPDTRGALTTAGATLACLLVLYAALWLFGPG